MHVVVKVPADDVLGFAVYDKLTAVSRLSVAEQEQVTVCPSVTVAGEQEKEVIEGGVASRYIVLVSVLLLLSE